MFYNILIFVEGNERVIKKIYEDLLSFDSVFNDIIAKII